MKNRLDKTAEKSRRTPRRIRISEPVHIKEILPRVMDEIFERVLRRNAEAMERNTR